MALAISSPGTESLILLLGSGDWTTDSSQQFQELAMIGSLPIGLSDEVLGMFNNWWATGGPHRPEPQHPGEY